ncbi:MAG: shikimate dehydrogenase [Muribaculaceae bacterium]|nr:shikimate dehydrogenase [Muribaculaceae bacterium]
MGANIENLYGLIGYPLGHSFSKDYFNQKFLAEGINANYINFEIPDINFLMEIISENNNLNGLNVTIPYKEQVIPYLDELDDDARAIGAVNVIKFIKSKNSIKLKGYNSDVIGFCNSIEPLLRLHNTDALILGTGGAAKAVEFGLKKLGIGTQYVSRTRQENAITYDDLDEEAMHKYTVIVNTTPLGMYPNVGQCPDIPYQYITPDHLCYDLLYNPDETLFLKKAKEKNAVIKNGLEMLLLQAFAAWNIWQE